MIGDNGTTDEKRPLVVALEDSIVILAFSFVGALLAAGPSFPPTLQILYAAGLTSLLAGIVSWAKARNAPLGGA